ncbi:GFA family protein [Sedimentitalea sp. XS_ASV28]|uniref:GFA family protein n=1 Tax=Sedimentitalea sp. XS_ASV28 TaxID=3241296 RepID=UPI003510DF7A
MRTSKTGGCMCGAVRYTLKQVPDHIGACHCGMCRKFSGGIELGLDVPLDGIVWEGEDSIRIYKSSDWAERGFCGTCGSSLFYRIPRGGVMPDGMMILSAGSLDDLGDLPLTQEVYIDCKPQGYAFAGDRTQLTEQDVLDLVSASEQGSNP